ncbi:hypothetical protein BGZ65_007253 [Modicella reniformis]|uniref:Uncharacterized protein n=1 Tax=Modicella reniformis TaxID=1440133 RepID=A0A9P6MKQ3_9FUNG|nr:hypothetical protein BGZ65_007253 [Modicella reniformis]
MHPILTPRTLNNLEDILESVNLYHRLWDALHEWTPWFSYEMQKRAAQTRITRTTRQTQGGLAFPTPDRCQYVAVTGLATFRSQGAYFSADVTRIALDTVRNAIGNYYFLSKFPEEERPQDRNAIDYFSSILFHGDTEEIIRRRLGTTNATLAAEKVNQDKGVFIHKFLYNTTATKRFDGYSKKVTLQSSRDASKKFKLRGTICTNGLELHLLAYDTSSPRRRTQAATGQGQGDGDGEDEDNLLDDLLDMDDDFELDDALLLSDDDGSSTEGIETRTSQQPSKRSASPTPGPSKRRSKAPRTASPPSSPSGSEQGDSDDSESSGSEVSVTQTNINWKRGSRLLPNVEVTFATPSSCPPVGNTVVVGMDPGL